MLFFTPLSTPYNTTNPSSTYPKPSPSLPSSFPASYLTHTNQMFSPGPIPNFPIPTPNLPCRSPQAFTSKLTLPPEQTSPNRIINCKVITSPKENQSKNKLCFHYRFL